MSNSAAQQPLTTPLSPVPHAPVIDPATIPTNRRHLIPRFDADIWPMTFTSDNPSVSEARLHWATFPPTLREQFRHAAWALVNLPIPNPLLARRGAAMRARLSTLRICHTVTDWRTFATWLAGRGITELAQVSPQVLTDYSIYLATARKVRRNTAINHLVALSRLHAYAPHLPPALRIGAPPWQSEGLDDYLPAATTTGENATEPINPVTMGPLLVWALRFVEQFSVDILAAHTEQQRMAELVAGHRERDAARGTPPALADYLHRLEITGVPLPTLSIPGRGRQPAAAATYIAAITNSPLQKTYYTLGTPRWRRYLLDHPGPCPLQVPITARINGRPWVETIDFDQVKQLVRHLSTACFVVIAYLTGMRASEVLALESGCCPDPQPHAGRSLIRARQFKTARDAEGNHLSTGALREAPWIAVPQVVAAIRVLEQLTGSGLLFPTDRGTRSGRSLAFSTMASRIEELIDWINNHTGQTSGETIPPDPHGHIGTARFRRTLAWHIARRPGGLVALAVQYGHLRTLVSEGYASRQRDGIHQLLDLETARAVAEHLSNVHDTLQHGKGISGPAARRLIQAAQTEHQRFGGIITTPRQAKALLSDPTLTVFENPDAYLTCNYDPSKALCNPNSDPEPANSTPSLDRCQATCPNIARTDQHAQQLRSQAHQLHNQANSALTPHPVAERLRHRAHNLIELADKHERTRIALTNEDSA